MKFRQYGRQLSLAPHPTVLMLASPKFVTLSMVICMTTFCASALNICSTIAFDGCLVGSLMLIE